MPDKPNWIAAGEDIIEADVVRWVEAIWSEKKRGRGKKARNVLIGKQRVTGQITLIDDDYVHVKVIEAELIEDKGAKERRIRKVDDIIRKKPQSLTKGEVERLLWSDEESRANIVREKNNK